MLSVIILLSIFLPISLTLVLNVEDVQNVVVRRASEFASQYLGTKVSIDRIDVDLFSRVRVEGFYVEDHEQDTLLYVERASARIKSLNNPKDGLLLGWARAEDGIFKLRELKNGELNIRPIVRSLQKPNGKSNFRMIIEEIEASGMEFCYERLQHRDPEYGIDYFDMQIKDIEARLENFSVMQSRVWADIVSLSAVERSGFEISNIATHFSVDTGEIRFVDFVADTEGSHISVPELVLKGADWNEYKDYINKVNMTGRVENSSITTYDLGFFAPGLKDWNTKITNADASFDGVVSDLRGEVERATIAASTTARGTFRIIGLPDWRTSNYIIGLESLHTTAEDVENLMAGVLKNPLPERVYEIVRNAEWADARVTFGGRLDSFRTVGNVATGAGDVSADVTIAKSKDGRYDIKGTTRTSNLNLGELLDIESLRRVTSDIAVNGSVGGANTGGVIGDVAVAVSGLEFGNYRYSAIEGKGNISGGKYYAEVLSDDPNLEFDLYASIDREASEPTYAVSLALQRADLYSLGVNRRDTISVLSANVGVDMRGAALEDMDGYISIADADYEYPGGVLHTDILRAEVDGSVAHKAVVVESDFFTLGYNSHSSYREVYNYLRNSLMTYVPLLYNKDVEHTETTSHINSPTDYTALTFQAGDAINDLIAPIVGGFVVAPDTELGFIFNPKSNNLTIRGSSEAVEYSGLIMANTEWDINNSARDSLSVRVKSDAVYMGSHQLMPRFNLVGGARENRISLTAGFKQQDGGTSSAMLGLSAQFSRNKKTNRRSVHINITPSHFTNDTQQWKLYSRGIDIDSTRISVNELHIARPDQQMIIDGVASRLRSDSIRLTLDNFDISPLSAFLNKWGYQINGNTSGYASVKAALGSPEIEAAIDVDSLNVNGITAPPQRITSKWDFEANRAMVFIADRNSQDTVIRGYYQPQGNRYYARANMKNMKLALISPFLNGILSDIEGDADIEAKVLGEGRSAVLSGEAMVEGIAATVDYTKVRYSAPTARLTIENNHILADKVPVYDPERNVGHYSMDISLEHLSNITYDIAIDANKMLVLDTDAKDNDLFYGHVYASGSAMFYGDKRGIKMDIDGTSADNSKFYMPLSGKEDVAYADFVKFQEPATEAPDTTAFLTRRMMAYERKNRPVNASGGMMDMDMTLNVLPNIEMQLVIDPTVGDVIKGKGSGQLTMHIVPKANIFEMRGDVQISEGTYLFTLQNILNKLFTVVPGSSIHWDGDPLGAKLNIDAKYSTKASLRPLLGNSVQGIDTSRAVPVDCYIKLTDDLMSPTVTFDVQVPNVAPEIQTVIQSTLNDQQAIATQMFWLLAANSFSAEDTGSMGASLSATTGFELLSNQLSNWLSGDNYNIVLRYRPRTELSGDEVDFGFSKSWLDNRLIVELEGGYLSDAAVQATEKASNFVGEAFITWLIDTDGTFRFRGFTQTIDRYGENQGMQEAGIGLYYGESFNTFKELGQSLKYRFSHRDSLGRVIPRQEYRAMKREKREQRRAKRSNKREQESLDIIYPDTVFVANEE